MDERICKTHKTRLEFLPGRPAHQSNLYCSRCEAEKETSKEQVLADENWNFVSQCLDTMQDQSNRLKKAAEGLMLPLESPLIDPHWRIEAALLDSLSRLIGDENDNLYWFVYDCEYGLEPREAGCKNDMRSIDSHERLRWLIELKCDK